MEKEYLSIKEFAAAVGVSQQAIYKQLNNKLKPYLKVVDNKKMLKKSALELFKKKEELNDVQQQLLNMLQTELKEKTQQLNEKDKQIAELQKALNEERELVKEAHALLGHEQRKYTIASQKILELEDKMTAVENHVAEEPVKKKWWQVWK